MAAFLRRLLVAHRAGLFGAALGLLLLLLLAWNVGAPVLHVWDEARVAGNAAAMLEHGDWLIVRYAGRPDLWNTKPPLLVWLQAASLAGLGYHPWVVRLPSVLAALAVAGVVYRFGRYTLRSRFVGTFAALILATSPGFNGTHVARFGDYDALLVLWLTAVALSWYQYVWQRQARHLWLGALAFALALLTKSAAALLVLPALLLYGLVSPAGRWGLRQLRTYAAIGSAFVPLALFYGLREAAAPGYLAAVWFNDWYGRFSQPIVTVRYPWWLYGQRLLFPGLLTWSWLLPVGCWLGVSRASATSPRRAFAQFAGIYVVVFLAVISVAQTRLGWYSAPVYPMAALLCALGLEHLAKRALAVWHWPWRVVTGLLVGAVLVPAAVLLRHEGQRRRHEMADPLLRYGYQLPHLARLPGRGRALTVLRENQYNGALDFYLLALRKQGVLPAVRVVTDSAGPQFHPGQQVLICSDPAWHYVQRHYHTRPLTPAAPCKLLEITGLKQ